MKNSNLFTLSLKDVVKGFVVAFLTAFISGLSVSLESSALPTIPELQKFALIGLSAGIAYLLKNFLTNSEDKLITKESPKDAYKK